MLNTKFKTFGHLSSLILLFAIGLLVAPAAASAHTQFPYWGPLVSCSGAPYIIQPGCTPSANNDCLQKNPNACTFGDIAHTFIHIVYFGMTIALFFAAPAFFAWGGILILISGANPSGREQGKKIITGTVIGVLITLFAFLIVQTFVKLLGIGGVGGFS